MQRLRHILQHISTGSTPPSRPIIALGTSLSRQGHDRTYTTHVGRVGTFTLPCHTSRSGVRRSCSSATRGGQMQRVSLREPGPVENMTLETAPIPEPGPGEVRVRVHACGICMRDVLDRTGAFPFINRPSVLGHEIAGVIDAVGAQVSEDRLGEKVVSLHWASCGKCNACMEGRTTHCTDAWNSFLGLTTDGGYAEYMVCGASAFVPVPSQFTPSEAATIVCTYGTFWHGAVTRGRLKPGERILITGATGGVGSAAVQLAKSLGCHVTAVTSSPAKEEYLRSLQYAPGDPSSPNVNIDEVIVGERTSSGDIKFHGHPSLGNGVDMVFDAVGAPTFNSSLRSLRPGGRLVLVGNVTAASVKLSLGTPIVKGLEIIGSDSVSPVELQHLTQFMLSNHIRPFIQDRLQLSQFATAHQRLESSGVTGRVVFEMESQW